jgi:hypothetical protein
MEAPRLRPVLAVSLYGSFHELPHYDATDERNCQVRKRQSSAQSVPEECAEYRSAAARI